MVKQTSVVCKNEANIFYAQDVLLDVSKYNTGFKKNKSTKDARGFWQLEIVVGPFPTQESAAGFSRRWKKGSRGIQPRRVRAKELIHQEELGVRLYDKRLVPVNWNHWVQSQKLDELAVDQDELGRFYAEVRDTSPTPTALASSSPGHLLEKQHRK